MAAAAGAAEAATIGEVSLAAALRRVEAGGFLRVDLEAALPPVSLAVADRVEALIGAWSL